MGGQRGSSVTPGVGGGRETTAAGALENGFFKSCFYQSVLMINFCCFNSRLLPQAAFVWLRSLPEFENLHLESEAPFVSSSVALWAAQTVQGAAPLLDFNNNNLKIARTMPFIPAPTLMTHVHALCSHED